MHLQAGSPDDRRRLLLTGAQTHSEGVVTRAIPPPRQHVGITFAVVAALLRADGGCDLQVPSALSPISKVAQGDSQGVFSFGFVSLFINNNG